MFQTKTMPSPAVRPRPSSFGNHPLKLVWNLVFGIWNFIPEFFPRYSRLIKMMPTTTSYRAWQPTVMPKPRQ